MEDQTLGQWLENRCQREHLSYRQAAAKAGLSHTTIATIRTGMRPSAVTIKKLVAAFSDGKNQRLALEDKLLVLAGYRTERPEEERIGSRARLMDKVGNFSEPQLKVVIRFVDSLVDFLTEIEGKD